MLRQVLCIIPEEGDLSVVVSSCQISAAGRETLGEHRHVEELQDDTAISA